MSKNLREKIEKIEISYLNEMIEENLNLSIDEIYNKLSEKERNNYFDDISNYIKIRDLIINDDYLELNLLDFSIQIKEDLLKFYIEFNLNKSISLDNLKEMIYIEYFDKIEVFLFNNKISYNELNRFIIQEEKEDIIESIRNEIEYHLEDYLYINEMIHDIIEDIIEDSNKIMMIDNLIYYKREYNFIKDLNLKSFNEILSIHKIDDLIEEILDIDNIYNEDSIIFNEDKKIYQFFYYDKNKNTELSENISYKILNDLKIDDYNM